MGTTITASATAAAAAAAAATVTPYAALTCSFDDIVFDFEEYVTKEFGLSLTIRKAVVCRNYVRGFCPLGEKCTARHPVRGKTVVCKHWLRGLCKKGETCEFLHEYNMRKMPECWFFSKYRECSNSECIYLHIDPSTKIRDCADFDRGFCPLGPNCKNKHSKKAICPLYLSGFCPAGPECPNGHPRFDASITGQRDRGMSAFGPRSNNNSNNAFTPHTGGSTHQQSQAQPPFQRGPHSAAFNSAIVCFRCGKRGHYANQCQN